MNEGKPAEIAEKMVQGRIGKFYGEICLLEQEFVKDSSIKVLTPTSIVAKAEFIPYENNDYIISEKDVTLEVEKKKFL